LFEGSRSGPGGGDQVAGEDSAYGLLVGAHVGGVDALCGSVSAGHHLPFPPRSSRRRPGRWRLPRLVGTVLPCSLGSGGTGVRPSEPVADSLPTRGPLRATRALVSRRNRTRVSVSSRIRSWAPSWTSCVAARRSAARPWAWRSRRA